MLKPVLLVAALCVTSSLATYHATHHDQCYVHQDHAAQYQMRHDKANYPTQEINLVLDQFYPHMKEMFKQDTPRPKVAHSPKVLSSVCPHNRFTLYSFFYVSKDCYVIYPDVQRISYVNCNSTNNDRQCDSCYKYPGAYGGQNRCDEDYEYRDVWAYCIQRKAPTTKPPVYPTYRPTYKQPIYKPPVYKPPTVKPYYHTPAVDPTYKPTYYQPPTYKPTIWRTLSVEPRRVQPVPFHQQPAVKAVYPPKGNVRHPGLSPYKDHWNQVYRPHVLGNNRWKRSYRPQPTHQSLGTIERMPLYLPYHCSCKRFQC